MHWGAPPRVGIRRKCMFGSSYVLWGNVQFSCLRLGFAQHVSTPLQGETSCPSFQTYMEVAEMIRENDPLVDTILLSSEDARFVEARHNYTSTSWRFVVNAKDVMQASGDRQRLNGHSMDDVFMSFYTTLQMQVCD